MNAEYVTGAEADAAIARWASRGTSVVYVEEVGDLAIFTQHRGQVELARPGVPIHRSGERSTTVFAGRFAEIVHVLDDAWEAIILRRPAGASGLEITLIADWTGDLGPEDVLLIVQAVHAIRPRVNLGGGD